jgi:hypothetical protein
MSGQILAWAWIVVGVLGLLWIGWPIVKRFLPASVQTGTTATIIERANLYTQYAAARAAEMELRVIDATNGNVDLKPELDALAAKLGTMFKSANVAPPATGG